MGEQNRNRLQKRIVDQPEPGFFRMKLVKKGPWVAAKIDHIDGQWVATINGKVQLPPHEDPIQAGGVCDIWNYAGIVQEHEYLYLIQLKEWAEHHNPDHPAANPRKPIDLSTMPPVFSGGTT